jgi:hypothetical protein
MYHHCQHQCFGTETQGGSLVGALACLCQQLVAFMSGQLCLHVALLVYICMQFVAQGSVVWAVISRICCWQRMQLEYKNSRKRGVWLAPAHLTLCLPAELLLVFR